MEFSGYQYIAKARTFKLGIHSTDVKGGCSIGDYTAYRDNGCAKQWARNNYGAHSEGGSVYKNKSICARGFANSDLYYILNQGFVKSDDSYFEESEYSTTRVKFQSKSVIMDSINIKLQAKGVDLFSSFEIMMWLPNKKDSVASIDKAFLHGKIVLMDGKVQGFGIFKDSPFQVKKDKDGVYSVTIKNFKAVGILPDGHTNENSIIEVMTSSDAGIDEKLIIDEALNNDEINVSVYPNPTNDFLNISLSNNSEDEEYAIKIYDSNGNFVKTIEENIPSLEMLNYKFNISSIVNDSDYYYIQITSLKNRLSLLRRIKLN